MAGPPPKQADHLVTIPCYHGEFEALVHWYNPARPRLMSDIHYDAPRQISQIKYVDQKPYHHSRPRWKYDEESIVITIIGTANHARDEQEKTTDKAGYGIFFGPGSRHNVKAFLPAYMEQTKRRAEIQAAKHALELAEKLVETTTDPELREIIILTESRPLLSDIVEDVFAWTADINSRNPDFDFKGVRYITEILDLLVTLKDIERPGNIAVRFWDKEDQLRYEAYDLANELWDRPGESGDGGEESGSEKGSGDKGGGEECGSEELGGEERGSEEFGAEEGDGEKHSGGEESDDGKSSGERLSGEKGGSERFGGESIGERKGG
ncbi:ribonuclease H-like protein [Lasiodiplodia theobromae]|uniref:Ribonuclease H-like protein n=1 Tax=Lasiodiplodia theobromae TaxID=45133 RepID=A0A5N5DUA3_9PEZI|nr:hypothetical protein DBV05_g206 [Lasiodiplodia theobromae]KAF9629521.1 ribonuclease H-like protein [Lasiodiplodia theobromae]